MSFAGSCEIKFCCHRYDENYDSRKRDYTKYPNDKVFWSQFLLSIIGATQKRRDNFVNLRCLSVTLALLLAADVAPLPPHFALFFRTSKLRCLAWVTFEGSFHLGAIFVLGVL